MATPSPHPRAEAAMPTIATQNATRRRTSRTTATIAAARNATIGAPIATIIPVEIASMLQATADPQLSDIKAMNTPKNANVAAATVPNSKSTMVSTRSQTIIGRRAAGDGSVVITTTVVRAASSNESVRRGRRSVCYP